MNQPSLPADSDKEKKLNRILAEYLQRRDAGQPVDQAALLKAYPELADGLQSYFEGEAMIGGIAVAGSKLIPVPAEKQVSVDLRETVRPGAMESDTSSGFAPRSFGRYELLRPLGEGAMGSVYLANDTLLERKVALKVPKAAGTSNAEFMARFTREAKAAAGLKHPNICSVFDAGEHNGTAYITMDFIDGVPLSRFIGSSKLKSLDAILKMLSTIAEAVGHAHSKGVIHRDLKPGNILVDAELKPMVTDFGLARRAEPSDESRITQEGLLIGTPAYMAPEQVKGEQALVGPQSDIYSLGVILYEMLTCRLPFDGSVPEMLAKVLRDTPPVPSHIRKDLPEDFDDLCLKMLKKLPEQRYSNIAELLTAISKLQKKIRKAPVSSPDAVRQQAPFEIRKSHVEAMLKKGQYAAAIQDLEKLAAETSPGSKAVADWAKATLPIARAESKALSPAGLTALLKTAEQMFQKSDYLGAIQLLEDVPQLRRTEAMEDLLQKARKRETDAEQLLADIKDLEHRQQIDGLEPLVKRFLKLKPGSDYGKRLMAALQSYSKTPASRRSYRYEKGRLQPMPQISFLRQWAVLGLLVGMLSFLSVTYYVLIYLKSGNQTLAVHVDDEWLREQGGEVSLLVDGSSHTISTSSANGENLTVVVTLGEHTFSVKHGDTVVHDPKKFDIEKDGRRILQITATEIQLTHSVAESPQDSPDRTKDPSPLPVASVTDKSGNSMAAAPATLPPLARAPFDALQAAEYQQAWATAINQPVEIQNTMGMKLRLIPPGEFMMGSPGSEPDREDAEQQHRVQISSPFYIGMHEVTNAQFETFVSETGYQTEAEVSGVGGQGWNDDGVLAQSSGYVWRTPGFPQEANHPVVHVSWNDVQKFAEWLSSREKATYRIPTEAEWEYSCRAGSQTVYSNGDDPENLVLVGNVADASTLSKFPSWTWAVQSNDGFIYSAPVGSFQPNPFGLHDLHGNAWEWCADFYDPELDKAELVVDPCIKTGTQRVIRGGAWTAYSHKIRSAFRSPNDPDAPFSSLGFRVVMECRQRTPKLADSAVLPSSMNQTPLESGVAGPSSPLAEIPDPNASLKNCSQVHGATAEELFEWRKSLPQDFRPIWLSTRANSDPILYDGVATITPMQHEWLLQVHDHNDDADWNEMLQTYRPAFLHVYPKNAGLERLTLWINDGRAYENWHGYSDFIGSKLQGGLSEDRNENGIRERWLPVSFCGNATNDRLFDVVQEWAPYNECEWELDLSFDGLLEKINECRSRNWRPAILNVIGGCDPPKFAAVFLDNPRNEKWDFSPRLTVDEYRRQLSTVDAHGGRPRCVCSREENGEVYYAVVWDYPVNPASQAPPVSDDDFHAVAPFNAARAKKYQEACAAHFKLPVEYTNSIGMKFQLIPPGTFTIGSSPEEIAAAKPQLHTSYESNRPDRADSEGPQQIVTLTRPFYLGTTEVTQGQFLQVMDENPSYYAPTGTGSEKVGQIDRSNSPVENMSWLATGEFCNRLSEHDKIEWAYKITPELITQTATGGYRLPTEAEWEFACRAGTTSQFWCGDSEDLLAKVAWFRGNNPNGFPSDVAKLGPNPFGLHDMHGNVWEWVHDCWRADTYKDWIGPAAVDPRVDTAPEDRRVMRGGDFFLSAQEARSACRDGYPHDSSFYDVGFRVALSVDAVRQMLEREQAK